MNEQELRGVIQRMVLAEMARLGRAYAPVMASNRHCHLSQADTERLFGPGYRLTKLRDLVQPGQYACHEKVVLETPKGAVTLRVVGPVRRETQVELSLTDCAGLGLKAPVRMSGMLENSPGCTLRNGDRRIPLASAQTGTADIINLLNECKVIQWDKFSGANPRGVRDGWQFVFTAEVNGGRKLYATGSNNFPKHFRNFTNALNDMIRNKED